jgi:hypothetical protein
MMLLIDFQRKFYEYGGKHSLAEIPQVVQVINKPEQLDELDANLQVECKDLVDHPGRKKIFILIDNYDSFGDEGYRKSRKAIDDMAILAREYSTGGLSFVISGSMAVTSVGDDLKKQIISANYGLALQSVDAVNKLNGKVARSMADVELPAGRSFFVKSGRTAMLQLATPYSNDENVEGSLDSWVEQIIARHPKGKAAWLKPPAPVTPTANGTPIAPAATAAEIEAFKAQLRQKGMADNLLAVLSNADILKMAADMGLTKPAADSAKK